MVFKNLWVNKYDFILLLFSFILPFIKGQFGSHNCNSISFAKKKWFCKMLTILERKVIVLEAQEEPS